jgi:hypothetical protein
LIEFIFGKLGRKEAPLSNKKGLPEYKAVDAHADLNAFFDSLIAHRVAVGHDRYIFRYIPIYMYIYIYIYIGRAPPLPGGGHVWRWSGVWGWVCMCVYYMFIIIIIIIIIIYIYI